MQKLERLVDLATSVCFLAAGVTGFMAVANEMYLLVAFSGPIDYTLSGSSIRTSLAVACFLVAMHERRLRVGAPLGPGLDSAGSPSWLMVGKWRPESLGR